MSDEVRLEPLVPDAVRERLEKPDRARNEKITARFTNAELEVLEQLASERREPVSVLARKLGLARLAVGRANGEDSQ